MVTILSPGLMSPIGTEQERRTSPLMLSFAMDVLLRPDAESYMRKPGHPRYPTPFAMSAAHRIITTTPASSQWMTERIEAILRSVRAGICPRFKDLLQETNSTVG